MYKDDCIAAWWLEISGNRLDLMAPRFSLVVRVEASAASIREAYPGKYCVLAARMLSSCDSYVGMACRWLVR